MHTDETNTPSHIYSAWFDRPVVLIVVIRDCHVPVQCTIVGESGVDLRVRIRPGWEMDIRKELVLAIEADSPTADERVN